MSSNPQHIENLNNLKSLGFDVDEYLIDTMESWGYDEQVDMVQGVISEIRPMALRIKELEAENKRLSMPSDQAYSIMPASELYKAVGRIKDLEAALKDCVNDYINFDGEYLTSSIFERAHKLLKEGE